MVFLANRKAGAKASAAAAKEKGGDAMLSYYHFAAKDKPYADIIRSMKQDGLKSTLKLCKQQYKNLMSNVDLDMSQKDYQRVVGEIEVFGECYIRLQKEI
jgi:DNA invertase Pin-like site-specific DNA recombinase